MVHWHDEKGGVTAFSLGCVGFQLSLQCPRIYVYKELGTYCCEVHVWQWF